MNTLRPVVVRLLAVCLSAPWAVCLPSVTLLAVSSPAALAAAPTDVTAPDYSADQVMTVSGQAIKSRVFHTAKAERREMTQSGMAIISIVRKDKNVVWSLMPGQKMYMETSIGKDKQVPVDLSRYTVQRTPMGSETLEGLKVNKSRVSMKDASSDTAMEGLIWETADGITVKMDVSGKSSGRAMQMVMQQSNIKVGSQPASLFEIPQGFSRMDMGSMGMGGMPGAGGAMGGAMGGMPGGQGGMKGMMKGLSPDMMKGLPPEAVNAMQDAMKNQGAP